MAEARQLTAAWKAGYNHHRPHGSLGYTTPADFAACGAASAPGRTTAAPPLQRHCGLTQPELFYEAGPSSGIDSDSTKAVSLFYPGCCAVIEAGTGPFFHATTPILISGIESQSSDRRSSSRFVNSDSPAFFFAPFVELELSMTSRS